jgi:hypothetical protein
MPNVPIRPRCSSTVRAILPTEVREFLGSSRRGKRKAGREPDREEGSSMTEQKLGPLVQQNAPAAHLAELLCHAAEELWDTATLDDSAQMWEDARRIASGILSACPLE